ncbi:SDR family NAD(P)-dependent oxidoreductase [Saccharothrix xinjiangensis]|uniref:SDR family NAD(P)-dependent oxidoreductase n=1 Tax=Saccharothrix xinjiangensis TaxID=204798 RepID=A0ABV9Y837_9PSEU
MTGKRALVTGSSSGLGEAVAHALAAEGAEVVVHGRDEARTTAVAEAVRAAGGEADVAIGDLGTDGGADAVAEAAGRVDVLVNNVGVFDMSLDWWSATPQHWLDIYNTNVVSSVRTVQRFVPAMRERRWGRVIQVGSITGTVPIAPQPHYGATAAARDNLARTLARELRETGVTSNAIAPGGILTATGRQRIAEYAAEHGLTGPWEEVESRYVRAAAPNDTGRLARPAEIAAAVAYLASPVADFLTGVTLRFDGHWRA